MAKEASFSLLILSSLLISCSGVLVGFSYHERGDTWTSFLQQSKVSSSQIRVLVTDHRILSTLTDSNVLVDLYLNKSQVENFITSKPSAISELKVQLILPHLNIKSIIASCGSECLVQNKMHLIMHALKSIHSILRDLHIGNEVKVSVAFPLQFLRKLSTSQEHKLCRLLSFIKETKSFVTIEDSIDGELSMGEHFVQTIIERAALASSVLPCNDVPVVLTIKSSVIPSSIEVAQFSKRVSKYLEARSPIAKRLSALYVELHATEDFSMKELKREEEEMFPLSRRETLSKFHRRKTLDGTNSPTNTVYPTNPPPVVVTPSDTPTIISVPSTTNPVTISPTNPAAMPVTVPSTTPAVPLPPTNPTNTPVPVFNPATTPSTVPGIQPVTNPVTSYPPPSGNVPVVNPQQPPPSSTNAPSIQGQSWCVAKSGAPQASLQSALDYACGMGGADCSQIQQGASCYSPVTLQNHASFAFNSYYQKNPSPTSCNFGGAAMLVNSNPSSGSCVFPSSSSSTSSSTPPMISSPTPPTQSIPTSTPPPSLTTPSSSIPTIAPPSIPTAPPTSSGSGTFGYGAPPSVLNSSNPASGSMPDFGSDSPPVVNTTTASHSLALKPSTGCIVLMISFATARLSMRP
ncbi:hypothetical protein TSUD_35230 [Trifolium subterraneum]|uniref:X8 domain-containing protein n=1 Tax=Trifolium subterraneum TaxID=3900 RepID=A0A2Z6MEH1_TRISU|nr:hypothetical protein TSUD_35230 [Trifolium subterraneum]